MIGNSTMRLSRDLVVEHHHIEILKFRPSRQLQIVVLPKQRPDRRKIQNRAHKLAKQTLGFSDSFRFNQFLKKPSHRLDAINFGEICNIL